MPTSRCWFERLTSPSSSKKRFGIAPFIGFMLDMARAFRDSGRGSGVLFIDAHSHEILVPGVTVVDRMLRHKALERRRIQLSIL